jgi:hypothetical protein
MSSSDRLCVPNNDPSRCDESYQAAQQSIPLLTSYQIEASHDERNSQDHIAEKPQSRLFCGDFVSDGPPRTTEEDYT